MARFVSHSDKISIYQGESLDGNPVFEDTHISINNNVYIVHGAVGLNPFHGKTQPYLEGLAGVN